MPSSAVRTFTDSDDYASAIRATRAEITVTARGHFAAKLTRIDLHRLWMQRFSDNLPRIGHSASPTGRAIISFRTQPGPSLIWGGVELQPSNSYFDLNWIERMKDSRAVMVTAAGKWVAAVPPWGSRSRPS
jgi:hypothetical protein